MKAQQTNYREALEITFVDNEISYDKILEVFFENVDLFDGKGQYIDRGNSYTLAIYYISDLQKKIAMDKLSMLEDKYGKKPEISVERFEKFFAAEDYHQKYYLKNPQSFEEELKISGRKKEK